MEYDTLLHNICHTMIDAGRLSQEDFAYVSRLQETDGGGLDDILIGTGVLSEELLQRLIADALGVRFWTLDELRESAQDLKVPRDLLPHSMLQQQVFVPWHLGVDELRLIVSRVPGKSLVKRIKKRTNVREVTFDLATKASLASLIYEVFEVSGPLIVKKVESQSRPFSPRGDEEDIVCPACDNVCPGELLVCESCGEPLEEGLKEKYLPRNTMIGSFQIERLVGSGGMSEVYRAIDLRSDEVVALKVLKNQLSTMRSAIQRFQREARTLKQLQHPGIVRFLEFGYQDGVGMFIATEFLKGREFLELIDETDPLPPGSLLPMVEQICSALSFAHQHDIIHRDLKPDNIILTELDDGSPGPLKLIDFGIAKILDDTMVRTQAGLVLGTPRYMAPEQVANQSVSDRSDIYSLAVILFEALTGYCLFDADNGYEMMMRQMYTKPPTLTEMRPDLAFPPRLVDLLQDSLSKDPEMRPQSMEEFRDRFAEAVNEEMTVPGVALASIRVQKSESPSSSRLPQASSVRPIVSLGRRKVRSGEREEYELGTQGRPVIEPVEQKDLLSLELFGVSEVKPRNDSRDDADAPFLQPSRVLDSFPDEDFLMEESYFDSLFLEEGPHPSGEVEFSEFPTHPHSIPAEYPGPTLSLENQLATQNDGVFVERGQRVSEAGRSVFEENGAVLEPFPANQAREMASPLQGHSLREIRGHQSRFHESGEDWHDSAFADDRRSAQGYFRNPLAEQQEKSKRLTTSGSIRQIKKRTSTGEEPDLKKRLTTSGNLPQVVKGTGEVPLVGTVSSRSKVPVIIENRSEKYTGFASGATGEGPRVTRVTGELSRIGHSTGELPRLGRDIPALGQPTGRGSGLREATRDSGIREASRSSGLREAQRGSRYRESLAPKRHTRPELRKVRSLRQDPNESKGKGIWLAFLLLVVLGIGSFLAWTFFFQNKRSLGPELPPNPSRSNPPRGIPFGEKGAGKGKGYWTDQERVVKEWDAEKKEEIVRKKTLRVWIPEKIEKAKPKTAPSLPKRDSLPTRRRHKRNRR